MKWLITKFLSKTIIVTIEIIKRISAFYFAVNEEKR